jgi:hypothetical protein
MNYELKDEAPRRKFMFPNIKAPRRKFMFPNIKFGHLLFGHSLFPFRGISKV